MTGVVTYQQLEQAKPALWFTGNTDWSADAMAMNDAARDLDKDTRAPLASGDFWSGVAADAALVEIAATVDALASASAEMSAIADVLLGLAESVSLARQTLAEAEEYARANNLTIVNGFVSAPPTATDQPRAIKAEGETPATVLQQERVRQAQQLVTEALREATEADQKATEELRRLAGDVGLVGTSNDDQQADTGAFAVLNDASATEVEMIGAAVPTGPPTLVASWWAGLSQGEQQQLMAAVPVTLGNLAGIPTSVKSTLAGADGVNRLKIVQYALENWNNDDHDIDGDNCADFASYALLAGGLQQVKLRSSRTDPDNWFANTPRLGLADLDKRVAFMSRSHTWTGAGNLHDFLVGNGSEQIPMSQVKPGDLLFWRAGNGNIHHATVVTSVVGGHIYYTQHTHDQVNSDLTGRQPLDVDNEGPQQVVAVRVGQDSPW